jgi:hypothetical protein
LRTCGIREPGKRASNMVALSGQESCAVGTDASPAHVKGASSAHRGDCRPGGGGGLLDLRAISVEPNGPWTPVDQRPIGTRDDGD